ncbi:hypothetical protein As57867_004022, partial [Aphanomyces stellatus]
MKAALILAAAALTAQAKLTPTAARELETQGTSTLRVKLAPTFQVLADIEAKNLPAADARQAVYTALTSLHESSFAAIAPLVAGKSIQKHWIANSITVQGVDAALADQLAKVATVAKIDSVRAGQFKIPDVVVASQTASLTRDATAANEWGVTTVGAPDIWPYFTGKGVVVGSIDTGALPTHEALKDSYRADHG